jgi:hypothetical protein
MGSFSKTTHLETTLSLFIISYQSNRYIQKYLKLNWVRLVETRIGSKSPTATPSRHSIKSVRELTAISAAASSTLCLWFFHVIDRILPAPPCNVEQNYQLTIRIKDNGCSCASVKRRSPARPNNSSLTCEGNIANRLPPAIDYS